MASSSSFPSLVFQSVAGPTWKEEEPEMKPFSWSSTHLENKPAWIPIDEFRFEAENHTWTLNVHSGAEGKRTSNR